MTSSLSFEHLKRDVAEQIDTYMQEVIDEIRTIYKRSKLDYVDKRDISNELRELLQFIEDTVFIEGVSEDA